MGDGKRSVRQFLGGSGQLLMPLGVKKTSDSGGTAAVQQQQALTTPRKRPASTSKIAGMTTPLTPNTITALLQAAEGLPDPQRQLAHALQSHHYHAQGQGGSEPVNAISGQQQHELAKFKRLLKHVSTNFPSVCPLPERASFNNHTIYGRWYNELFGQLNKEVVINLLPVFIECFCNENCSWPLKQKSKTQQQVTADFMHFCAQLRKKILDHTTYIQVGEGDASALSVVQIQKANQDRVFFPPKQIPRERNKTQLQHFCEYLKMRLSRLSRLSQQQQSTTGTRV